MTDTIIDNAISSLQASPEPTPEAKVESEAVSEASEAAPADQAQADPQEPKEVEFPKKAVNAISRRDKIIEKERANKAALQAERDALQAEIAKIKSSNTQKGGNDDGRPKEEDFDTFAEYLKADLLFELERNQATQRAESENSRKQEQLTQQQLAYNAQREQVIVAKGNEYVKSIPDFQSTLVENADIADEFPAHVVQAFYEADDGALAFYNLAKEGRLEELATMNPYKAAMEIARAESKKPVLNKITNAATPIAPVKGSGGAGSQNLGSMSYSDLKKFLAS